MAFVLKFDICEENCTKFTFTETTGAYNSSTNPTGWNTPNPNPAFATVATLDVYKPSNTTTTPSLTIDLLATGDFPDITTDAEYIITNTALGYSGRLPDGVWKFVYTVTIVDGATTTYSQTIEKVTYCNAKCCVDGLWAAIEDFDCECMDDAINKANTANAIYMAMVSSADCGKKTTFSKLQKMLERLCNNTNCCS